MTFRSFIRPILFFFLFLSLTSSLISCTSSEDDSSVLEGELETMGSGGDEMADDVEGLDDMVEDGDSDSIDVDDSDVAEFSEEDSESDEMADSGSDEEFSDDEFSDEDFNDGKVAEGGSDGGDEFDEFAELDEGGGQSKPFAQDEEALAKELKKGDDYPVAQNAQPQFPEEVIGSNTTGNPPPPIPGQGVQSTEQPFPPGGTPLITSETQELMDMPDPIEPIVPQDDLGMADPIVPNDEDGPEEKSWVPVVKIKTDPFFRNQRLMNAVYIARPEESLASISEKIYGQDRSKDLLADNGHLDKGVDPGDKIYYNSPNRSDDKSILKFYYDDIGLPVQTYLTKSGDNIRRLGTKLLGFSEGWKELWAINPNIDSKTILPTKTEIRYWTGNESKTNIQAANAETKSPKDEDVPEADPIDDMGAGQMGAATTDDPFQESDLPPEPPLPEAVAGPDPTLEPEPADIEPFPDAGIEETPIPPPQTGAVQAANDSSLLSIGAIALLIMAGAGLVAIQIKRRKDATTMSPGSLEYTQV